MSTIPPLRGTPLYRYIPGVGRVAAIECVSTGGVTGTCATAYSTADQTLTLDVAANIQHDVVGFAYGISVVTGANGYFKVPTAGVYKIIPSVQYLGSNNGELVVWIKVNGTNVPDSATLTHFKNNDEGIVTTEYLLELAANDEVQVWSIALNTGCDINYIAAGGSGANAYPAAPGIITNMYRIR